METGTLIIRPGTEADLPAALELIQEFHDESIHEYGFGLDPKAAMTHMITQVACSLVAERDGKVVGVIAGSVVIYPVSGEKCFLESVWFMSKEHRRDGIKLVNALESWCKANAVNKLVMCHMANSKADKLTRFYNNRGFKLMELHYVKNL